jgi:5-methylcytosine-specific restriction protein A
MEARYNKHQRDPAARRRYGPAWPRIRAQQLATHPLCAMCHGNAIVTPANEVHHCLPLSHGGTHAPENLLSLCKPCHSRITVRASGGWRGGRGRDNLYP